MSVSPMGSIIRNFSLFTEFCLVVFIAFGLAIAGNCGWMISHWEHQITSSDVVQLKNDGMVVSVVYDVVILGIVLWIGRIRGWSLKTFGTRVTWKLTGPGVLLFLAFQAAARLVHFRAPGRAH